MYQLVFLLVSFPGSFSIRFHRNWVLRNKTYFFNDCTNFDETKQKLEQREVRENNINIFKNSHCKIGTDTNSTFVACLTEAVMYLIF